MGIYRWVGAGLLYCRLLTIIVGETRPYEIVYWRHLSNWSSEQTLIN